MSKYLAKIKYPIYLFLGILLVKLGYIVVESYYNYHVLTVTTNASLTKEMIESLNINGHRISAIGITLLIFPFLYFLSRTIFKKNKYLILIILSIGTYLLAFSSLNMIVETIVKENKDKRHDAYYVNVFKYGILNNIFVYDSFVDSKKIQNNMMDVNDRILLANTFLLLHADEKLISKLKDRGREKVADLYIDKNLKEDYALKSEQFIKASEEISLLWNEINKNKLKIKNALEKLDDEQMQEAYETFTTSLKKAYYNYKKGWEDVNKKIAYETTNDKLYAIKKDLRKYFRYERFPRVRERYRQAMFDNFGHFLDPVEWKDNDDKVTSDRIKYVIKREILQKVDRRLTNVPYGLDIWAFMYHYETRYNVMKKLKENDIHVPYDFNYSLDEFAQYFKVMSVKKHHLAYDKFYTKLDDELGVNDIKLSMDYKEFIYSKYIYQEIQNKLQGMEEKDIQNILKALHSKDLANFRQMVYLPKISKKVEAMDFVEEDFQNCGSASCYGDNAIKLLYIPPFALSISMIALLLNIITVFGMIFRLVNLPNFISDTLKISLVVSILLVPLYYKEQTIKKELLNQTTMEARVYLNFLAWISYYEKQNSLLHEKKLLPKLEF